MIHEILVVLAGYPSSLDTSLYAHPSEQDIFESALDFGRRHKAVKDMCRECGPLAPEIEKRVLQPFLSALVGIEKAILSGSSVYGAYPAVSLATIHAHTVLKWDRQFDYAYKLLDFNGSISELAAVTHKLRHSGFPEISELAMHCVAALDRAWLRGISSWLLWGRGQAPEPVHPMLDAASSKSILEIGLFLQQSQATETANSENLRAVFEENQTTYNSIAVPISAPDLRHKLSIIETNFYDVVLPGYLSAMKVQRLLELLRQTALGGSTAFCDCFLDVVERSEILDDKFTSDLWKEALEIYLEDFKELELDEEISNGLQVLIQPASEREEDHDEAGYDDLLFGARVNYKLAVRWPFHLYIGPVHCLVYSELFSYLMLVRHVMRQLAQLRTPETNYYLLIFNHLWQWFQANLDEFMKDLSSILALVPREATRRHSSSLKELGGLLLLNDAVALGAMRQLILAAFAAIEGRKSSGGVDALLDILARRAHLGPLYVLLEPFAQPLDGES